MIAKVGLKKLNPKAFVPVYMSSGAAGVDVCACLDEAVTLEPGKTLLVPTGLAMEIQPGFECQVRSRSGLAAKNGVVVLNSPGTIDSDYRGEVKVILHNTSDVAFTIKHGDRVAQLVFAPVAQAHFTQTTELSDTMRGTGGFGSTGVNNG